MLVLDAAENAISAINLDTSPSLQTLKLNDNLLTTINLTNNTLLTELLLYYNDLTLLDIHANTLLSSVDVMDNNLQTLIIKNGQEDDIYYDNNPSLTYICADDVEIPYIMSTNASLGLTNTVVNSYCTFTPGGLYYTVTGNTRFDANSNGCDSEDPVLPLQKFTISSGTNTANVVGTAAGNYAVHVQSGTHIIAPVLENPSYFNVSPASVTANFPTQTSPLAQNFCVTANGNHNDLEVTIIPLDDAVPGYNAAYKISFKNKGTTIQSGTLVFNYDDNLMNFLNSTVIPDSQSTGVLSWNFFDLNPFESDDVVVTFILSTPTATPALNSGDILNFTAQVTA